jgi:DNA-binding MarR family transcriptional regulator
MNDALEPVGVTAAQADAITVIGQAEPLSLKSLGDLLIAEAGHPSRLVDRLVQAGWVERGDAADDRRRIVLTLTPEGRRLRKRIEAARQDVLGLAPPAARRARRGSRGRDGRATPHGSSVLTQLPTCGADRRSARQHRLLHSRRVRRLGRPPPASLRR